METTATMKIDQDLVHSGLPSLDFAGTVRVLLTNRLSAIRHLPAGLLDDVLLVASELINNACEATPEDTITFKASFERRSIWVGVWDSRNDPPRPKPLIYRDDIEADVNALNEDYESEEIGGGASTW